MKNTDRDILKQLVGKYGLVKVSEELNAMFDQQKNVLTEMTENLAKINQQPIR